MIHHLDHYQQESMIRIIMVYFTTVYKTTIASCLKTSHLKMQQISVCFVLHKIIMKSIITIYTIKPNVMSLINKINVKIGIQNQTYHQIQSNGHFYKIILVDSIKQTNIYSYVLILRDAKYH